MRYLCIYVMADCWSMSIYCALVEFENLEYELIQMALSQGDLKVVMCILNENLAEGGSSPPQQPSQQPLPSKPASPATSNGMLASNVHYYNVVKKTWFFKVRKLCQFLFY